ncbi:SDR family NAD(P)-dependent oxidoreductase [Flammeovirga sp. SJP92]|uniref:SDR family NAD(P)-dependent oxidoreductase n=1 Tax=Flammeovirga sp. SJP92 TaxID=1775430 RepID=UPI000788FA55|nr:SDR family oxidoreductase [Flammeovirga sp. SJP92]KXX69395.1 oxidoreductase [Flammeovirga sp. SJP92]
MKKFLVIGGSSGIGRAVVKQLSDKGHEVFATYNTTSPLDDYSNVQFFPLNILDETLDFSVIPNELDGLVYCPGAIDLQPFSKIAPQAFIDDFNLQVVGAVKVIQACINALRKGKGSVVLYSTVANQMGFKYHSLVAASKGAIEGLTKSLASEYAPKVRFNAVAPSLTATPLASKFLGSDAKVEANAKTHPLQRIGIAEDIANITTFLLSDQSSWITGQVMHVDGGLSTLKM